MGKYVYLVRKGQFNIATQKYEFYDIDVFTSLKKVEKYIDWVIEVNRGYRRDEPYHYSACIPDELKTEADKKVHYQVDYKWRGQAPDGQVEVKSRIVVEQKVLQ
jgi:hypothetical protein